MPLARDLIKEKGNILLISVFRLQLRLRLGIGHGVETKAGGLWSCSSGTPDLINLHHDSGVG
jgi:hypothetical protein